MRIALIDIPNLPCKERKSEVPSLSLGYLGASLISAGYRVFILDAPRWRKSYKDCFQKVLDEKPDVIGFTSTTNTRFATIGLIKEIKKRHPALMVVGGPHFTFTAKDALEKVQEIDIAVRSEGELTLLEVLKTYSDGRDYSNILGITYRGKNGEVIENKDRPFIQNLDILPPPSWELFDLKFYHDTLEDTNQRIIGVVSSRGCPQRCAFCANSAIGKATLRLRTPALVVDEIENLQKNFGYSAFKFSDDTLTVNKNHIINICKEIIRRNLGIRWSARVRVNTVDEERLDYMKKAGCISLHYGIESGSPRILKLMRKEIDLQQVRKAVKLACAMKFEVIGLTFMVSYPGENISDLDITFKLMKELKSYSPAVRAIYGFTLIYPGTELERIAYSNGALPNNFSWNSYYRAHKYFIAQCEETDIYYENRGLALEEIRAYISSNYYSFMDNIKKAFSFSKRIHSIKDFPIIIHLIKNIIKLLGNKFLAKKAGYLGDSL